MQDVCTKEGFFGVAQFNNHNSVIQIFIKWCHSNVTPIDLCCHGNESLGNLMQNYVSLGLCRRYVIFWWQNGFSGLGIWHFLQKYTLVQTVDKYS